MLINTLYTAKLLKELNSSFLPNAGNTGNIIRRIPLKSLEVWDLRGGKVIFLLYCLPS